MTKQERLELAEKILHEEKNGINEQVQALGQLVLSEVLRLEQCGETEEAKAFEAFLPLDEEFLFSLVPIVGIEEFEQTIRLYKEEKYKQRMQYLDVIG